MSTRHYNYQVEVTVKTNELGDSVIVKAVGALKRPNLYRRGYSAVMGGAMEGSGVLRISPTEGLTFTIEPHTPDDLERKLAAHNLEKEKQEDGI